MQKQASLIVMISILFLACNNEQHSGKQIKETEGIGTVKKDTLAVFPVTDYLLGQIKVIEDLPVTPLQTFGEKEKVDSNWIKREDIRKLAAPFLTPVIDSASLNSYFSGNSFLDQTVNAVTFTYTALPEAPGDISLREINVYVDPQTNEVQRIYLVKEKGDTTFQLTWKSGSWFSIRTIHGSDITEERVKWNFDE